jgi:hypothetical protein
VRWWQRLRAAVRRRVGRVRVRGRGDAPVVAPAVGTRGLGVVGSIAAVTDPTPTPPPDDPGEELAVDVRAFLPDGVSLEGAEPTDEVAAPTGQDDDRPEPEIPAWALDDPAPAEPTTEVDAVVEDDDELEDEPETEQATDDLDDADPDAVPAVDVELVEVEGLVVVEPAHEPPVTEPEAVTDEVAESAPEVAAAPEAVADQDDEVDEVDEVDEGPALPAWALPDPIVADEDDADDADDAGDRQGAVAEGGPAIDATTGAAGTTGPSESEKVDTSVLEQIEGELAEVEAALAAIDAGDLDRSPLLVRLLADRD